MGKLDDGKDKGSVFHRKPRCIEAKSSEFNKRGDDSPRPNPSGSHLNEIRKMTLLVKLLVFSDFSSVALLELITNLKKIGT